MSEQENKMIKNWEVFYGLLEGKLSNTTCEQVKALASDLSERIITTPASTRTHYIGAFPGGLVWHSLNVLKYMKELKRVYEFECTADDLIITSLFHDLGKVGTEDEDYYVPHTEWHKEHGNPFQINPLCKSVNVPTLSLWWLQKYEVPLTFDQMNAISSSNNLFQNIAYHQYEVRPLTMMLQQAIWAANIKNKGQEKL